MSDRGLSYARSRIWSWRKGTANCYVRTWDLEHVSQSIGVVTRLGVVRLGGEFLPPRPRHWQRRRLLLRAHQGLPRYASGWGGALVVVLGEHIRQVPIVGRMGCRRS